MRTIKTLCGPVSLLTHKVRRGATLRIRKHIHVFPPLTMKQAIADEGLEYWRVVCE